MSSSTSQAMAAKAKAMYGSHLKETDYNELLRKNSVQEIASYLKNDTRFRSNLEGINESTVHRAFLEILIRQGYYLDFLQLIRYGDTAKSRFYRYGVMSIEINQILITLRNLDETDRSTQIAQLPMFANKMTGFDMQGLIKVTTYEELLAYFRNTAYYDILKPFRPKSEEDLDYAACEIALKKYYYKNITELINSDFSGAERQMLKDLFDTRIELENLTAIYRLKKYYKSSSSKIKSLINPTYLHIPKKLLFDWIENKSAEEILEAYKHSYYHIEFEAKDYVYIEHAMDRVQFQINKRILRFAKNPDITLVAYLSLLEIEIQNIIDIIEGVRYKVDHDRIAKLLIF
jgi:V/A-type H+-transporting ATPase subunit C